MQWLWDSLHLQMSSQPADLKGIDIAWIRYAILPETLGAVVIYGFKHLDIDDWRGHRTWTDIVKRRTDTSFPIYAMVVGGIHT